MADCRRLALIAGAALIAALGTGAGAAPEPGPGSGSDIDMEPEPVGSGSGSGVTDATPASVKDPKLAKKLVAAAQLLVQKGDGLARAGKSADAKAQYDQAVIAYQKAIEIGDDATVYLALALVEDKAGSIVDAYHHLKLLLATPSLKPDVQKKAQTKLDELAQKVGTVALTVTPAGTSIALGDKQIGEAPMAEPLVLSPGTYTLTFQAAGFQPKTADFKVEAGSESERKIELQPAPIAKVAPNPAEAAPEPVAYRDPSLLPIYVGAGATGGLVLVATITGISAIRAHNVYTARSTLPIDRQDSRSNGRAYAHATDLCLVGALGAAAFTAYWYQYKYLKQLENKPELGPKAALAPWVQPDAGGLVVAGSF